MVNRCSSPAKDEWLTCTERRRRGTRPEAGGCRKKRILMTSHHVKAGDLGDRLKHRSACSTREEDLAAATVTDGSTLEEVGARHSRNAISGAPRAAAIAA